MIELVTLNIVGLDRNGRRSSLRNDRIRLAG